MVCKEEREISGRISRYSFSFFSDFREYFLRARGQPARRRRRRGRARVWKTVEEESFRVNQPGEKARSYRLLSWLLLVLQLRGGYCARCEWFLRARLLVSNARSRGLCVHRFLLMRSAFVFGRISLFLLLFSLLFFFEIDEISKGMRRGGWTRRRKERRLERKGL